jgi:hypothetical protein
MQVPANDVQFSEDTAKVSGVGVSFERLPHQCCVDEFLEVGEVVDIVSDGFEIVDIGSYTVTDENDITLRFVFIIRVLFVGIGEGVLEAARNCVRCVFEVDELALSVDLYG